MLSDDRHHRGTSLRPPQVGRVTPPERPDVSHAEIHAGQPRREREAELLGDAAAALFRQCRVGRPRRRSRVHRARRLRHRRHLLPQMVLVFRLGLHRHSDRSPVRGDNNNQLLVFHDERTRRGNKVGPQATDK